jgi:anaerobic ribonucleoside-triphosphate reductase activating protein
MTTIAISRVHFPLTTLGPGRRVGIWMQGCSIRCPGCISADTWAFGRGDTHLSELLAQLDQWLPVADGITISGGEPFDQAPALEALLRRLRERTAADILVYSGHSFETLQPQLARMEGLIDALMTDPFIAGERQSLALRGSDNQRLHLLTPEGKRRFTRYCEPSIDEHAFDVMFDEDGSVWFAGIPRQDEFRRIKEKLTLLGHGVTTTEDASLASQGRQP